jgi:hypothetical protein
MSTSTKSPPTVIGPKSLASSAKFKTFALVLACTSAVMYVACDMMGWPLFSYHPMTNRLEWFRALPRKGEGPVMYWYGWTASSLLCGSALGFLATMLPETVSRKIPLALVWILPLAAIPPLIYSLMPFWTR